MSWQRIKYIIRKEFIQIGRDRLMLRLLVVVPLVQLIILGYAVTTDLKNVSTVVCDGDRTPESRQLIRRFSDFGAFKITRYLSRSEDISPLLKSGEATLGLAVPKGFSQDVASGRTALVQVVIDGSDATSANMILGATDKILHGFTEDVLLRRAQMTFVTLERLPGIDEQTRVWYNKDLKSVNYVVPGILCLVLLITSAVMTSMTIVKERETGTLEQLIVTPIRAREIMIGKMVPSMAIGFVDIVLILLAARFWFRVPIAGSIILLLSTTAVFLMTGLGVGLFVSTVSRTQQQAMMTSQFLIQPSILLSGFMYPIESMPRAIQYLTYLIPLRYYLAIVRGIVLKGSGLPELWPDILLLFGFGIMILSLSILRFTKKLG